MNSSTFTNVLLLLAPAALAEVIVVNDKVPLREPFSVVFAQDGTLFGVEYENGSRVFSFSPAGAFKVIAGKLGKAPPKVDEAWLGDGKSAAQGRFNGMHDLARTAEGTIFVADTFNHRIRMIKDGTISTFAGGAGGGFSGDGGPASKARFKGPHTVTLNAAGDRLLVADLGNRRVREVALQTGIVRTVAGNGEKGIPKDGTPATAAPLVAPRAACYGKDGSIFIASREGHALRQVKPDGKIYTVVNASGKKGYFGDGGDGKSARLNGPKHLSLDPEGNVVIADDVNHCIRLYKPASGTIHLLAGIPGRKGNKIGESPLDTELNRPHGTRYDAAGNFYVADSFNHRILKFPKN